MMDKGIAKRYSLALFRTMQKKNHLEETKEEFKRLRSFLDEKREIKIFLYNYPVKEELKKEIVRKICSESECSAEFLNFLLLLVEKKRFNLLEMLEEDFIRMVNEVQNIAVAQVSTPFPLHEAQKEEMVKILAEVSGKKIQLEEIIKPELKGGFILRLGEKVFDASITTRLKRLYQEITA